MLRETMHADLTLVAIAVVATLSMRGTLAFHKYGFSNGLVLGITMTAVDCYQDAARRNGLPQSRAALALIAASAASITLILQQAARLFAV